MIDNKVSISSKFVQYIVNNNLGDRIEVVREPILAGPLPIRDSRD